MMSPVKKILVYIDGTEQSITAAQYAICLSKFTGAELTAQYVINTKALDDLLKARIFFKQEQEEYARDLEADAKRYLDHVLELARVKGVVIDTKSTSGSVNQEILNEVKDGRYDLLVIGELSRTRSRRDEFYNEVERALRSVPCSVLVVKDDEHVWQMYSSLI
ncbi:universal stress protein [candidate division KSB1 bacterium]|nr:universal stress protein [candidate division KSB1 bacterium]